MQTFSLPLCGLCFEGGIANLRGVADNIQARLSAPITCAPILAAASSNPPDPQKGSRTYWLGLICARLAIKKARSGGIVVVLMKGRLLNASCSIVLCTAECCTLDGISRSSHVCFEGVLSLKVVPSGLRQSSNKRRR